MKSASTLAFIVLVAALMVMFVAYEPQVVAIEVSPARIEVAPKGEQQLAAVVRSGFPNPFRASVVTWNVSPATIGTIGADGAFRAGAASGSGVVTARSGGISASVTVQIECPRSADAAGLTFSVTCTSGADVYLESRLAPAAAQTILRAVDGDVARVEADFGRSFARRPLVYAFASKQSFAIGLREILAEGGRLPRVAVEADGIYVTGRDLIGVDWEEASRSTPFTTLRHELTHKMVAQIVGANTRGLPAWLDEGLARLEETTIAGTQWLATRERYLAISMAATGTLFSLEQLADLDAWGSRTGVAADHQYHQASQTVSLLREDLGPLGLVRVLELIGSGKDFAAAYALVAGKDFADFAVGLPRRLRTQDSVPGVVTAADTPKGAGLTLILYGFTPSTQVEVTLANGRQRGRSVDTVSQYGGEVIVVGSELPTGTYTVTAAGANGRVTVTARKTS